MGVTGVQGVWCVLGVTGVQGVWCVLGITGVQACALHWMCTIYLIALCHN